MAASVLTDGCETRALRKRHTQRIQAAEMKFLRGMKGCSLRDQIKNEDVS